MSEIEMSEIDLDVQRLVDTSRAAQDLPATVADETTLARVVGLIAADSRDPPP